ncbi:ATP-binding protein [bacterium CPR1]|nr:ATP-binding protein [bacterium CPR1]
MSTHPFVMTGAARRALDFLETARLNRGEVSLLVGPPGSGKSAVVAESARGHFLLRRPEHAVVAVTALPGAGPLGLLQALLDQVAPGFRARSGRHGLARLVTSLRRQAVELVLVDEAQHLYKTPLEMLRMLHQRTAVSVVLCGEADELRVRLATVPLLRSHLHRVHLLEQLAPEEALAWAAAQVGQPAAGLERLVETARGNWDRLVRLVRECRLQARREAASRHLEGAVRQMEERDERAA